MYHQDPPDRDDCKVTAAFAEKLTACLQSYLNPMADRREISDSPGDQQLDTRFQGSGGYMTLTSYRDIVAKFDSMLEDMRPHLKGNLDLFFQHGMVPYMHLDVFPDCKEAQIYRQVSDTARDTFTEMRKARSMWSFKHEWIAMNFDRFAIDADAIARDRARAAEFAGRKRSSDAGSEDTTP